MPEVLDARRPEARAAAVQALHAGGVIALPTDTVYGIAALPGVTGAADRLFALKGRARDVPVAVLCADADQALALADDVAVTPALRAVVAEHWPGPLTVVLPRRPGLDLALGEPPSTVGLRCPDDDVVRTIARQTGPLATTSANRHGDAPATTAAEVLDCFGDGLALVLDGGVRAGAASTVIDATGDDWVLLRAGPVTLEQLEATARRRGCE